MSYQNVPGYFDFEGYYSEVVRDCPKQCVLIEVGSWLGRSVIYLAEEVKRSGKDITVFAVDTWRGSFEHCPEDQALLNKEYGLVWRQFVQNIRANHVSDVVIPMCLPSVDAARYFEDKSAFMVYLDAQHNYEAVKADIAVWRTKVSPGGMLAGHDYGWNGPDKVKKAVDEAFAQKRLLGPTWVVQM